MYAKRPIVLGWLFFCLSAAEGMGQVLVSSAIDDKKGASAGDVPESLNALLLERRGLAEEMAGMTKKGTLPEQMAVWHAKNAALVAALRQETKGMSGPRASGNLPSPVEVQLPDGASKAMKEFFVARTALQNDDAKKLNALARGTEEERRHAFKAWRAGSAAARTDLRVLARRVAEEKASAEIQVQKPPVIPPDTPSELRALLTEHHALVVERVAFMNQARSATPEERALIVDAWQQRNQTRLRKLSERLPVPATSDLPSPTSPIKEP